MSVIDYSKWDHLNVSSDGSDDNEWDTCGDDDEEESSDDVERETCVSPFSNQGMRQLPRETLQGSIGFDCVPLTVRDPKMPASKRRKKVGKPKFVKLHPLDNGKYLDPVFYMNPDDFVPLCNEDGVFCKWGIPEAENGMDLMNRQIAVQSLYWPRDTKPTPEVQFVRRLIEIKAKKLEVRDPQYLSLDFILKIRMNGNVPEIWRRFKVSGGVTLNTFQDKIVTPIMGWVRNYHAYYFTDRSDGAVFGPVKSDAIDMCWIYLNGWEFFDDTKVRLGQILQKKGDALNYIYDMGDKWDHEIVVEKVLSAEESNGSCEVIAGEMRCPPEDSNGLEGKGNDFYQDLLDELPPKKLWKGPNMKHLSSKLKIAFDVACTALNVKKYHKFDPYEFSVSDTQRALKTALNSTASTGSTGGGSKKFIHKIGGEPDCRKGAKSKPTSTPGEQCIRTSEYPCGFGPYMEEIQSLKRDQKPVALCSNCGSPNKLHMCSACHMVRYCGRECQKAHWKQTHKDECKKLAKQHKQVKRDIKASGK
ncbi:unnamed protein product [Owenia fusiformis]|uniref:Uncharacterized protein n=1 Tax=Owenia fusiformis TaxID=6347 RepID=A0A8J1TRN4_OWEFU|nr:unnamed protein product [Owenia fusiformis]